MTSNPSFNKDTGGLEVGSTYGAEAAGKTMLVTGVSVGTIGDAIVRSFAKAGASTIVITGRSDTRLEEVVKTLSADYPSTKFRPLNLQLDSVKLVSASAQELLDDESIPHIDILVACAGLHDLGPVRSLTKDGIEMHFGVNHIGHFLFITKVLPKIQAASKKNAPGSTRVIMVSSEAANMGPVRFSDYQFEGKSVPEKELPNWEYLGLFGVQPTNGYEHFTAYAQSKTANVLFAVQLNTLFAAENIRAFAVHPGLVGSRTALEVFEKLPPEGKAMFENAGLGEFKNIDQGSATVVVAALDPALDPESGVWLSDCQVAPSVGWTTSPEEAKRLWALTEQIISDKLRA